MNMTCPSKLFSLALFCAIVGYIQPAKAVTITIDSTSATVDCSAAGVSSPECQGFTGGTPVNGTPTTSGTLSDTTADLFSLANSSPSTQLTALNTLAGTSFTLSDVQKTDTGGVDTFTFLTDAAYFLIKGGFGEAFFQNNATGIITLTVTYDKNGAKGGGLSHITVFGGTLTLIPLPVALPMFLAALVGLFWVGRRRRRLAGAA